MYSSIVFDFNKWAQSNCSIQRVNHTHTCILHNVLYIKFNEYFIGPPYTMNASLFGIVAWSLSIPIGRFTMKEWKMVLNINEIMSTVWFVLVNEVNGCLNYYDLFMWNMNMKKKINRIVQCVYCTMYIHIEWSEEVVRMACKRSPRAIEISQFELGFLNLLNYFLSLHIYKYWEIERMLSACHLSAVESIICMCSSIRQHTLCTALKQCLFFIQLFERKRERERHALTVRVYYFFRL